MVCTKCGNDIQVQSKGEKGVTVANRTCCVKRGCGAEEMILPRTGRPALEAMDIVRVLIKEFPRDDSAGICRYCGFGWYDDESNPEIADSHANDCPWAMANTVAGLVGEME
jgi:hypothetical protein